MMNLIDENTNRGKSGYIKNKKQVKVRFLPRGKIVKRTVY